VDVVVVGEGGLRVEGHGEKGYFERGEGGKVVKGRETAMTDSSPFVVLRGSPLHQHAKDVEAEGAESKSGEVERREHSDLLAGSAKGLKSTTERPQRRCQHPMPARGEESASR
jgi:hypothetical protein